LEKVARRAQLGIFVEFFPELFNLASPHPAIDRLSHHTQAFSKLPVHGGVYAVPHIEKSKAAA
jgi:hypothetical protein